MDSFIGIEVGAEVELNDGTSAVEDYPAIKLENKHDLPLWHHLHHFDDSSSDESLDQQYMKSKPLELQTLEMPSQGTDIKSRAVEHNQLKKNIYVSTNTGNVQSDLFYMNSEQRNGHLFVMNNTYNKTIQEQPFPFTPYIEEPEISCTEVISSLDLGQLKPYSTEVCTETAVKGKYSYFDARTQCNKSINPLGRSYRCQRCGRQFGRLYNLEKHMCIKMAVGCSQQNTNNIDTMNRLEKMCAEAQKELQNLQGQYTKEVVGNAPSSSETLMWSPELRAGSGIIPDKKCTVTCDHQECELASLHGQGLHIPCNENTKSFASQSMTAFGNMFVFDLTNSSPIFCNTNQELDTARCLEDIKSELDQVKGGWTNLNQKIPFQTSAQNPIDTNTSSEATKIYQCQECGKVFSKRVSITNHMRWHLKENDLKSSLVNKPAKPKGEESHGINPHVGTSAQSLNVQPAETFNCEYCEEIFLDRHSYVTHTLLHMKTQEPVTVLSNQGAGQETGHLSVFPIKEEKSDKPCTSPVDIFTCQHCEGIFNNHCAYVSHGCLNVNKQELTKEVKAEGQNVPGEGYVKKGDVKNMDRDNMVLDIETNKGVSYNSNIQGYCRLVGQLSLDEKHNISSHEQFDSYSRLPMQMEPDIQRPLEVMESVLEFVVGTQEVHEILLSDTGLVFRKSEALEVLKDKTSKTKLEPKEKKLRGKQSKTLECQTSEMQLKSAKKLIPVVPSRLSAKCLHRCNPTHRCRDCGICFYQSWQLKRHRLKGFGKKCTLKKHQCDCGRTPVGSLHFLLHQLQHLSDTAFICEVCNRCLQGYRQLQAHSWVHPMVSHFECKCGARFTKLPKYLWHSLKNKAKPRSKLKDCAEALV